MQSLVLGSQSPRRKALLEMAGFTFKVKVSHAEEVLEDNMSPDAAVLHLSRMKSKRIDIQPGEVLLTADTVVSLEGDILGKPRDVPEALTYLRRLSGRTHEVYTGCWLRSTRGERSFCVCTKVTFFDLTDREMEWYVSTGEVWDKAGGYGIQGKGALFVEKIEGDYHSVVGLPISRVVRELRKMDVISN